MSKVKLIETVLFPITDKMGITMMISVLLYDFTFIKLKEIINFSFLLN